MHKMLENINLVLAEWDPIGVGENIAAEEYKGYIPLILRSIESRQKLMNCLEDILINKIGAGYNPTNEAHSKDLQQVCDNIIEAYKLGK